MTKKKWGVALIATATLLVAGAWLLLRQPAVGTRVYRIGWALSPPFQAQGADGKPTGLAVDLVKEAARRRGIRLQWILWKASSDSALASKTVELWPLITITPERMKKFHITEPYLESEYSLLVRQAGGITKSGDLATGAIGVANPAIDTWQLRRHLPAAHPVVRATPQAILTDVCEQHTDAAFMDAYTAISTLLDERVCVNQRLRWIATPEIRSRMGIGAAFEAEAAADALRDEIGVMAEEGKLAPILGQWGYMTGQNLASIAALLDARRHVARLTAAAAGFALLLLLSVWQTIRLMRQRNQARQTELVLRETEQKLRLMGNNLKDMVLAYDMRRSLIYANPAVQSLTGYAVADLEGQGPIHWVHADDRAKMAERWEGLFRGDAFQDEEYRLVTRSGPVKWVAASWGPLLDDSGAQVGVQGSERDITEHRLLEEQYLQVQKLESVGRLAGGVAHDFNNLLTVINGYSDMAYRSLREGDPLRLQLDEIRKAGGRAAELTQQLLVLSRKQVTQPRPVELNALVTDSEQMFQRVLGEDIEFVTDLCPGMCSVRADPGQLHQVLLNLVVNSRDAMPRGGRLVIKTSIVAIDGAYVASHPESATGPFVLLEVRDTGEGMSEQTKAHIFEPFFTTKAIGKGTGLGLSTVYGIVKQVQGWVWVESELGKGTAFQIYIPQMASEPGLSEEDSAASKLRGSATVLVVEDQDDVRSVVIAILKHYGYRVLSAADGEAALSLVQGHEAPIHLLLTDVVMPGMAGNELATRVKQLRPQMKVLFTSGYTQDLIGNDGVLERNVAFLAKPYTPEALGVTVREVLAASG
jgi:PAS domain S-box-containing protein